MPPSFAHRAALAAASLSLAAAAALPVHAQPSRWPDRPVRLVVASPPGDGADQMARVVGQKLQELLGQPFVVDNKVGAGGIVGTMAAKNSPADGYHFFVGTAGTHGINPAVYEKLPYDPVADFEPVMLVNRLPNVCVVNAGVAAKTLAEFVALVKQSPGKHTFASGGNGTSAHLTGEYLKQATGMDLLHIPYKGASAALQGVVGGQVDLFCGNLPPALTQIKAGRVRALAVTSPARSALLPEVPTVAESGHAGFESVSWFGIFALKGTPPEAVQKLHAALAEALKTPFVRDKLAEQGTEAAGGTPDDFRRFIAADIQRWTKVARAVNLRL
jgi:tripartite-type tricarboxylate transporter receptor subunit TctC